MLSSQFRGYEINLECGGERGALDRPAEFAGEEPWSGCCPSIKPLCCLPPSILT